MSALDATRQRRAFTDALRPPAGYVLGACIGTTYSLAFEPFTAVLLAFVGADIDNPVNDAPSVLTAVARLRGCLRVFVNSGSLHPPGTPNRLFALYDRILRRRAMESGAFHPKVWVMRFDPVGRPERHALEPVYRLLAASRNVTDSGCWELGVVLQGTQQASKQRFGSDVSAFCRQVAAARDLPKALWKLIDELKSVVFVAPREASEGLRFDWQWPGDHALINRLPRRSTRALLISPFVRADFLNRICDRVDDLILVSTQEELDRLSDHAYTRLSGTRTYVVTIDDDEEMPSLDLHAKLLAWESDQGAETLVGSANATGPGWGCGSNVNCEAMVSLKPGLGIDAVMKSFVSPSKDQLHPWIEQYRRQPEVLDPEKEATKRLEDFKRLLCTDQVRGEYNAAKKTLNLLTARSPNLSPLGEAHAKARAALEADEVVASPERLRQLLDDVTEIESARGPELQDVRGELGQLKAIIQRHLKDPDGDIVRATTAARALIYLRDPYDAVMDQHSDLGLDDDRQVIRSAAQAVAVP